MLMRWWMVPLLVASLKVVGCSEEPKAEGQKTACVPRKTTFCRCPGTGEGGWQTCQEDGAGLGECLPCDGSNLNTNPDTPPRPTFDEAECGNDIKEPGEQCDDGNLDDADACLSTCRRAKCGDGIVHIGVEECDDGNDDNTDGCTDECEILTPPSEKCPGDVLQVTADPAGTRVRGDFKALQPNHEGSCGGTGRDAVYSFVAPGDGEIIVSLAMLDGAKADGVIHVRAGSCDAKDKEVVCVNAGAAGANESSDPFVVTKGSTYFVFVDSQDDTPGGFSLRVRFRPDKACEGQGGPCEVQDLKIKGQCILGTLVCSEDKSSLKCEPGKPAEEVCGNGVDDDCDGFVDNGCTCAHDICSEGTALAPNCKLQGGGTDPCIAKVCEADDYCCAVEWDDQCVGAVLSFCKIGTCIKEECAHPLCQTGAKLTAGCDGAIKCVETICKTDSFCCGKTWDATCVDKVTSICGIPCK
jgi:cysteine-rich repeat protein